MPTRGDPALVKALVRAHRWQRMLESGRYRSLREGRMLALTLLAPQIVEAILDGRHPAEASELSALLEPFPCAWPSQAAARRSV